MGQEEDKPAQIRDFSDLLIWRKAITLGKLVYAATSTFPRDERFGLTSQPRRAAVSISSNIAEGHARRAKEYSHFLTIARGSLAEVESQMLFAGELGSASPDAIARIRDLAGELHRMMVSLASKL